MLSVYLLAATWVAKFQGQGLRQAGSLLRSETRMSIIERYVQDLDRSEDVETIQPRTDG